MPDADNLEPYYVLNESQFAELATLRLAIQGFSQVLCHDPLSPKEEGKGFCPVSREGLASLATVLERRLGEIAGALPYVWIEPATVEAAKAR